MKKKVTADCRSVALLALLGPWVTNFWTSFCLYLLTPAPRPPIWPGTAPASSSWTDSGCAEDSERCFGWVAAACSGSTSSSEISWRRKTFVKTRDYRQIYSYYYRLRNPWNPRQSDVLPGPLLNNLLLLDITVFQYSVGLRCVFTRAISVQQMTRQILLRQDVRQRSSQPGGPGSFPAQWKIFLLPSLLQLIFCRESSLTLILIVWGDGV